MPEIATTLESPIHVRVRRGARWDGDRRWWHTRGFSFVQEQWFERHAGRVRTETETIVEHMREVDSRKDLWAIVTITHDLGPSGADGMSPEDVAAVLGRFDGIRRRIRAGARTTAA
jgi:hypothetical protein